MFRGLLLAAGLIAVSAGSPRYQNGYDLAGNRVYARVTQATLNGTPHVNDRSYKYGYDALQRLSSADLGRLGPANGQIINDPAVPLTQRTDWGLDDLGNWTSTFNGYEIVPGVRRAYDTNGDGSAESVVQVNHAVDVANAVQTVTTVQDGEDPVVQTIVYDLAGNLVFDGDFFYQYDGFNGAPHVNDRSYKYGYDALQRLSSADLGRLNADNTAIEPVEGQVDCKRSANPIFNSLIGVGTMPP